MKTVFITVMMKKNSPVTDVKKIWLLILKNKHVQMLKEKLDILLTVLVLELMEMELYVHSVKNITGPMIKLKLTVLNVDGLLLKTVVDLLELVSWL